MMNQDQVLAKNAQSIQQTLAEKGFPFKVIEAHLGEKIIKADADFTRQITGFSIGGIPPVAHKEPIDLIFIDEDLLNSEEIWAAAGTP